MDPNDLVNLILQEKENETLKTKEETNNEIKIKLYNLYKEYLDFEVNKDNFRDSYSKLEDEYKYIEMDDIYLGTFVRHINDKYFYDIKLAKGGFVSTIDYENRSIRLKNGNSVYKISVDETLLFEKLNEDDKIKQMIIEALDD